MTHNLSIIYFSYHSNTNVGDFLRKHGHIGTFAFVTEDCKEMCHIIDKINRTVKVIDESGNDLMIRYTDFEYIMDIYNKGLSE